MKLKPQAGPLPVGTPSPLTEPFWSGCAEGELRFQRCGDCGFAQFPPGERCRGCAGTALTWDVSSGRGEVYSWTVVHRAVTPAFEAPYAPAIVQVEEGWQLMTNLVDIEVEDIRTGMPVQVRFAQVADGVKLPYFAPRAEG